jgi:hypothetical protein
MRTNRFKFLLNAVPRRAGRPAPAPYTSSDPAGAGVRWRPTAYRHEGGCCVSVVTQRELGRTLNPHLFRKIIPTELAIRDPAHVGIAQPLLGHADDRATQLAYNLGRALDAAGLHHAVVQSIRAGSGAPLRAVGRTKTDRQSTDRVHGALQEDIVGRFKRLRFAGVRLFTISEGEISELHVGLKGTMNALFLKDLADKTRRGLEGRVREGRSGGGLCFGYDVVREHDARGEPPQQMPLEAGPPSRRHSSAR